VTGLRDEEREVPRAVSVADLGMDDGAVGIAYVRRLAGTEGGQSREDASVAMLSAEDSAHRYDVPALLDRHHATTELLGHAGGCGMVGHGLRAWKRSERPSERDGWET
jgi:hypothetical protein